MKIKTFLKTLSLINRDKMVKKEVKVESEKKGLKIIGFVFGLIAFLTCGIPIFNIVSIILAIIGLVFSIIALKKSEKKGLAIAGLILNILAILIGIVSLLIVGGIYLLLTSGGYSGNANLTYANYSLGEKISSGNVSVTVLSADKSKQIKNNQNQIIPIETTGYFLSVKINLENRNFGSIIVPGNAFTVVDSQGRIFSALSDAEKYYPNSITSSGAQVQPGVLFNGIKIFEVPENSIGLKLKTILSDKEGAYVKLD